MVSQGVLHRPERTEVGNVNRKIIFLPINKDKHWSLCTVFYSGFINNITDDDDVHFEVLFMLFLDPLYYNYRA